MLWGHALDQSMSCYKVALSACRHASPQLPAHALPAMCFTYNDLQTCLQAATQGDCAALSMTTSTAGLLANMQGSIVTQPSNAESEPDTIQAFHGASTSSSAAHQSAQLPLPQQAVASSSETRPFPTEASTRASIAADSSVHGASDSPRQRPLFTASLDMG